MRGKRSKQYRKLMQQYGLNFGIREPFQVLMDAEMVLDAARFKMNFLSMLSKTLHGEIKPMITTCCMRHLYASKNELVIGHAKQFERRRCNHQNLEEPLSAFECLASVVDPKGSKTNKNHYVLACQDEKVRTLMRTIPGVPLIYLKRSVMIMEPMAGASEEYKSKVEASKFASGVQGQRDVERAEQDPADRTASMTITTGKEDSDGNIEADDQSEVANQPAKKRKRGPTGPNPLSVKKPKKQPVSNAAAPGNDGKDGLRAKRRRKRQSKSEVEQAT